VTLTIQSPTLDVPADLSTLSYNEEVFVTLVSNFDYDVCGVSLTLVQYTYYDCTFDGEGRLYYNNSNVLNTYPQAPLTSIYFTYPTYTSPMDPPF
jgi:hypothetical protein